MSRKIKLMFLAIGLLGIVACENQKVYDKNLVFPEQQWNWQELAHFKVPIEDTNSLYSLYLNTRISRVYPYSNLWVVVRGISPSGDTTAARVELTLFEPNGRPLGLERGSILEYSIPAIQNKEFKESGTWHFTIEHNMRVNTLPGIYDIGLALEPTGEKF